MKLIGNIKISVILVDNNSRDKTINIVKKLSKSKNYKLQIKNLFTTKT